MAHFCDDERELCKECQEREDKEAQAWHDRMEIEARIDPYYIRDENGD